MSGGPRVVLVGPMGAGKTTVGRLLGSAWGVPVRDTDEDVEARDGRSVADIFVESGEERFRELETQAVAESTLTCIMGRESAYSGKKITWDEIMASKQDLTPAKDLWKYDGKVPVPEFPVPGKYKFV